MIAINYEAWRITIWIGGSVAAPRSGPRLGASPSAGKWRWLSIVPGGGRFRRGQAVKANPQAGTVRSGFRLFEPWQDRVKLHRPDNHQEHYNRTDHNAKQIKHSGNPVGEAPPERRTITLYKIIPGGVICSVGDAVNHDLRTRPATASSFIAMLAARIAGAVMTAWSSARSHPCRHDARSAPRPGTNAWTSARALSAFSNRTLTTASTVT